MVDNAKKFVAIKDGKLSNNRAFKGEKFISVRACTIKMSVAEYK